MSTHLLIESKLRMSGAVLLLLSMPLRCTQENVQLTFNLKMYKQRKFGSYARI